MSDPSTVGGPLNAELHAIDRAVALIVFSADGKVLRPNANFLKLFGHRTRELVGQPHSIFVPPGATHARAEAELWAALRRGEVQCVVRPRLRRDGQLMWVRANYAPVSDADGKVVEVVLFAIDVTADKLRAVEDRGQVLAIEATHAIVHLGRDGVVGHANARFLEATGYALDEVVGAHHRLFVPPAAAQSPESLAFWSALAEGRQRHALCGWLGKHGRKVLLQATCTPLLDSDESVFKVVVVGNDVTAEQAWRAHCEGQISAINESHAVITFDLNGTVIDANENFLNAVGYRFDEVEGRHHRMFVDPSYSHGPEYAAFWNHLIDGRQQSGEYRRIGKNGREVWLQASYNPIRDLNGRILKIVKYATDVTREKLRQADHQGQIASIHNVQCVISFALDGTVLDANDNFLDATGYRLSDILGRNHRIFVDDATAASPAYALLWSDLAQGRHHRGEYMRLCKDGTEIWLQASYNTIFDTHGRPFKVVKYAVDITQERQRQLDREGQFTAIRRSHCVASFALDGTLLEANDNFLARMGYEPHEVIGRHHRMFVDPAVAERESYEQFWGTLRSGQPVSDRFRRVGKGGKEVWMHASYNPVLDLHGRPFKIVKIAIDVSESVTLAAQVVTAQQQAEHDSITGLPNRVGLQVFMGELLRCPDRRVALLYLDLDHFKPINDTFGHAVGDQVLKTTATRLREALQPDQMVARLGGDEFIVVAPDLPDEEIDVLCRRLLELVRSPIRHGERTLTVGLSIGVAVAPDDAATADDLMRCADVALYRTKGNGRNGYSCFAVSMHERMSANRHLAREMSHGINAGEFAIEYQPHFEAGSRSPVSVRAIVHWTHPDRGRIEQGDFLPLAERSALVVPLGAWVLRAACQAMAGRPGPGLVVDVWPVQLAGTDLPALVQAILAESWLPPARLTLSVPDRVLPDDIDPIRPALGALKALGVRLLLDGFAAHRVSLASLRDLGFDDATVDPLSIADIDADDGGHRLAQELRRLDASFHAAGPADGPRANGQSLWLGLGAGARVRGLWLGAPLALAALDGLTLRGVTSEGERFSGAPEQRVMAALV